MQTRDELTERYMVLACEPLHIREGAQPRERVRRALQLLHDRVTAEAASLEELSRIGHSEAYGERAKECHCFAAEIERFAHGVFGLPVWTGAPQLPETREAQTVSMTAEQWR